MLATNIVDIGAPKRLFSGAGSHERAVAIVVDARTMLPTRVRSPTNRTVPVPAIVKPMAQLSSHDTGGAMRYRPP